MTKIKLSIEEARKTRKQFRTILLISIVTIGVGTFAMMQLENLRLIDAVFFSVVSLTTVGYGDITPQTDAGKIFTMFYLIIGIAIIATLINIILKSAIARRVIVNSEK